MKRYPTIHDDLNKKQLCPGSRFTQDTCGVAYSGLCSHFFFIIGINLAACTEGDVQLKFTVVMLTTRKQCLYVYPPLAESAGKLHFHEMSRD